MVAWRKNSHPLGRVCVWKCVSGELWMWVVFEIHYSITFKYGRALSTALGTALGTALPREIRRDGGENKMDQNYFS